MFVFKKGLLMERMVAFTALVVLIPGLVVIYPFLVFLIGKPVLFKQKRIGQKKQEFMMYKIRSMSKNAETTKNKYLAQNEAPWPMFKIAHDPRFIKKKIKLWPSSFVISLEVGKFLSQSGLDELPQLWNVLRGEMSLVGPRPLPVSEAIELEKIDQTWSKWRSEIKPGIFSVWALDPKHNKSFMYWKKLEKIGLHLTLLEKTKLIMKVIFRQLKHLFDKVT